MRSSCISRHGRRLAGAHGRNAPGRLDVSNGMEVLFHVEHYCMGVQYGFIYSIGQPLGIVRQCPESIRTGLVLYKPSRIDSLTDC